MIENNLADPSAELVSANDAICSVPHSVHMCAPGVTQGSPSNAKTCQTAQLHSCAINSSNLVLSFIHSCIHSSAPFSFCCDAKSSNIACQNPALSERASAIRRVTSVLTYHIITRYCPLL